MAHETSSVTFSKRSKQRSCPDPSQRMTRNGRPSSNEGGLLLFSALSLHSGKSVAPCFRASAFPFHVGYAQSGLRNGASLTSAQFTNVTGDQFDLENFIPTGDDVYNAVAINTIDAYGFVTATYTWTDAGGEGWDTPNVWVDDDNNIVENVKFAPGQGLWVNGADTAQGLQSAGKVSKVDVAVQLQNGATLCGNPFPVSVALNDIYPTGDDVYNAVAINLLDEYGFVTATYTWTDAGGEGWDTPDVWVDDDNNIMENVTFAPGQGLWVNGASGTQYLNIPAPEL